MIMDYKQVKDDVLKQYDTVMPLIKEIKGDSETTFDTTLAQLQRDVENIRNDIFRLMIVGEAKSGNCNISLQNNINKTRTTTQNTTRRGLVQEALKQAVRDKKFNGRALLDSIIDGGACSSSVSEVETLEALTSGVSFDMQNGMAIEMAEFCDKAIERLKFGQSIGLWGVTITYSATDKIASDILESCISGEIAKPTTDILPMGKNPYALENGQGVYLPKAMLNNPLLAPITSAELGMLCTPPADAVPNFELKQGKVYPMIPSGQGVVVGKVSDGHRPLENMEFSLSEKDLNKHTLVCGITGSGKTTTVKGILRNCDKPFMVIESAKKEYRNIKLPDNRQELTVYTLGKPEINCLQFNPFFVQRGINLQTHIGAEAAEKTSEIAAETIEVGTETGETAIHELGSARNIIVTPDMVVIKESSLKSLMQSNIEGTSHKVTDVKTNSEYLLKYGYLGFEYVEFFGMNPRQGLKSDLIEQTLYMHKYFPATSDLIAIENQGEGDYYLVDSEDVVYEYDVSLKRERKTGKKLFEHIVQRFENV